LKFKTPGRLPIIFKEFIEYTLNLMKKNQKMPMWNQVDLETLGYQPVMPKNLPGHWSGRDIIELNNKKQLLLENMWPTSEKSHWKFDFQGKVGNHFYDIISFGSLPQLIRMGGV
jgi:hypothetical protein